MVDLICKFSKPDEMLEINSHNMYLLFNIGTKKLNIEEDDIGKQLINLKTVNYKFNVNEIFIFRTLLDNKILLYKIMENELYIFNSRKKIINAVSYIDNYLIIFYENYELEIINHKTFKYLEIKRNTTNIEDYISLLFKVIEEDLLKEKKEVRENIKPLLLPHSKINTETLGKMYMDIEINGKSPIICERIWALFSLLDNETCYCYSIIENNIRVFKYLIKLNNKYILFDSIYELIKFLKREFYEPLKLCSYLT
jgi:hypothetical protein